MIIDNLENWLRAFATDKLGVADGYVFDYRQYASVMATIITEEKDPAERDANLGKILKLYADDITQNCPPDDVNYLQETVRMVAICWR